MTTRENIEEGAHEPDPIAVRIAEEERRRSGEFLRDYLARHRIENAIEADPSDAAEPPPQR